ncbi:hypothetical protein H6P81_009280 [Aristolochia fimbriata]|uniref:Methyl-CpG-binding domain-containing protein 2 n=1 Tax=Aristolochia fimbriata TaxID=158543 RepID=A0AAV7EKE3_ARIFI|nr:hypothetical protein H6P81_009280 [Aristolochia fimbriata]
MSGSFEELGSSSGSWCLRWTVIAVLIRVEYLVSLTCVSFIFYTACNGRLKMDPHPGAELPHVKSEKDDACSPLLLRNSPQEPKNPREDSPQEPRNSMKDSPQEPRNPLEDSPPEPKNSMKDSPQEPRNPLEDSPQDLRKPSRDGPQEPRCPLGDSTQELRRPLEYFPREPRSPLEGCPREPRSSSDYSIEVPRNSCEDYPRKPQDPMECPQSPSEYNIEVPRNSWEEYPQKRQGPMECPQEPRSPLEDSSEDLGGPLEECPSEPRSPSLEEDGSQEPRSPSLEDSCQEPRSPSLEADSPQEPRSSSSEEDGDDDGHSPESTPNNQIVLYNHAVASNEAIQGAPPPTSSNSEDPLPKFATSTPTTKILPSVGAFTVQCARCFKWRLIPTKEKYEEIRAHILEIPFECETAREWRKGVSCDDPADINQDGSRLWAIDKPSIALPPPGWQRLLRIRGEGSTRFADVYYLAPSGKKLRSMVEIDKYLLEHPEFIEAGVNKSQFSFQIPKPLQENYVRKRPASRLSCDGANRLPEQLGSGPVKPLSWAGPGSDPFDDSPGLIPLLRPTKKRTPRSPKEKMYSTDSMCSFEI